MVGCYPGEEEAAKAAEQVTAAVKSGVSLPVCLASGLVRYLHQIRGSVYAPVGGGVVSASFLNAKHAVGGIGVEPRRGDMLRVLFAVESDAVADAVVRNRCCLCGLGPSVAVFDVLSDREEARHQALWPAFLAAKAAGKRVQPTPLPGYPRQLSRLSVVLAEMQGVQLQQAEAMRWLALMHADPVVGGRLSEVLAEMQEVQQQQDECTVCMDRPCSVTLLPCSHRVLCTACCAGVRAGNDKCPVCRHKIERTSDDA
ncbi:hypothetical protein FOA52_004556 [Chlamydomonas sp. UWO 241]|nr:hypothetical protein FOA52_004556 [Chlamydomonas sp. UWO 241]